MIFRRVIFRDQLKVSGNDLTNRLKAETEGRITEEDYSSMPLEQSNEFNQLNSEEVLLAGDIKKLSAGKHLGKFSMLVSVEVGEKFRKLVGACGTKSKPVYSQLVAPIITRSEYWATAMLPLR